MIHLNYRDNRPIYEQVKDGLRKMVMTGAIPPGEKLPSVRQLAAALAINPNTIQRAVDALEQEGYVYSVPGKGSFAAQPAEVDAQRKEALLSRLDAVIEELRYLGVAEEELVRRCRKGPGASRKEEEKHD